MATQGIARVIKARVDDLGEAFFKNAYSNAQLSEKRRDKDSDLLRAAMVQIARDGRLDLGLPQGQAAAMMITGAALALGLEEAAEGDMANAVQLLRSSTVDNFIEVGLALQRELRDEAKRTHDKSIVELNGRWYGILDASDEQELAQVTQANALYATRDSYHAAKARVEGTAELIELCDHFPWQYAFGVHTWITKYHQEAFSRKSREVPNERSGLLSFFVRSYLIKSLTEENYSPMRHGGTEFIIAAFTSRPLKAKQLVEDVFFDPENVRDIIPKAFAAFKKYLESATGFADMPSFGKEALRSPRLLDRARDFAEQCIRNFVMAVREYFRVAEGVDVSVEELNRFWGSWILMHDHSEAVSHFTLAQHIDQRSPADVLRLTPQELILYLERGGSEWSQEFRAAIRSQYPWQEVIRCSMQDGPKIALLSLACEILGTSILNKAATAKSPLSFWIQAWAEGSASLRQGILELFEGERVDTRMSLRKITGALRELGNSVSFGGDTRLLDLLLKLSDQYDPGKDSPNRGLSNAGWAEFIQVPLADPQSIALIYRHIPSARREAVLSLLSSTGYPVVVGALRSAKLL